MTPAARLSAAIGILDRVLGGAVAEKTLTNWARGNRYAGSGDRHAIRDLVFDALRNRRSFAHLGGGDTGRGLILGGLRAAGLDPAEMFSGQGYAPAALTDAEIIPPAPPGGNVAIDCPDWLAPLLRQSLGDDFAPVMRLLQRRAPLQLRVNTRKSDIKNAIQLLEKEGIMVGRSPLSPVALEVTANPRKVQASEAYLTGLIELQDAASQAVVQALPLRPGARVLDYCAGGGGKSLAMAAAAEITCFAHDIDPRRMIDLPARAARAGVQITQLTTEILPDLERFDLVFADAPCSGSGSWRRTPEAKWALTPDRLCQLCGIQAEILDKAAKFVSKRGHLAYATCSLLEAENQDQIATFLSRTPGWACQATHRWTPLDGGDGFFVAILARWR
tara:strand:- start:5314 stop:6480 length:1167 start_codon:yes stop_codon:yes gene_type:complete